jgi:hypothetical protein
MRSLCQSLLFLSVFCGLARAQQPQQPAAPKPKAASEGVEARLTRLTTEVEELKKLTVELPTLQRTLNDVSAQLATLRQEVDTFRRITQTEIDERARLDGIEARIKLLSEQVGSVRATLQAESAPESSAPFGNATYKDGFLLATEDGAYSLRLKGYLQLRQLLRLAESSADDVKESSFLLRRARMVWDGTAYSPRLGYKLMVDLAQGNVRLLDYYLEGRVHERVSIRGGQYKVPLSRNFMNSADQLSFVERSVATEELRYDRDIGVLVTVKAHQRIELQVGVFNGAGPNVRGNDNIDPLLMARAQGAVLGQPWKPEEGDPDNTQSPALMVGAAGAFENTPVPTEYGYVGTMPMAQPIDNPDVDGDGDRDNVRVMSLELDAAFRWRGLGIEGEAYFRREKWGTIGRGQLFPFTPKKSFQGGFVQATYFLVPGRYQLGARAAFAEVSPLSIGGKRRSSATCTFGGVETECFLPLSDLRTEFSVLAAYYRHRHGIELSAMYSFLDWTAQEGEDPAGAGEHRFLVESQLSF